MIHLIYVSSATKEMTEPDLRILLEQCRTRNLRQGVTGMLLHVGGNFIQVLEGEESDVNEIYADIVDDDRNTGNILISKHEIAERSFPNWSMGFRRLTSENKAEVEGFTDFLDTELTPNEVSEQPDLAIRLLTNFKKHNL